MNASIVICSGGKLQNLRKGIATSDKGRKIGCYPVPSVPVPCHVLPSPFPPSPRPPVPCPALSLFLPWRRALDMTGDGAAVVLSPLPLLPPLSAQLDKAPQKDVDPGLLFSSQGRPSTRRNTPAGPARRKVLRVHWLTAPNIYMRLTQAHLPR